MPYILLSTGIFAGGDRDDSEDFILGVLGQLTRRNHKYLKAHPETPKLYNSGVEYAYPDQMTDCKIPKGKLDECRRYLRKLGASAETVDAVITYLTGIEMFRDIPKALQKRRVDCDNLACWRCAELWLCGITASPYITWRETSDGTTYHALVMLPDGTSEDPSRLLGLGEERERQEERRKNRERHATYLEAARMLVDRGELSSREAADRVEAMGWLGAGWPTP